MADSITKVRKQHQFYSGSNLAEKLLFHNFVTGCTMLVRAKMAKEAMPFCPYMVHDHYIVLYCAEKGKIETLARPLINYRIHGGNQTGLLAGVTDKKSYGSIRILEMKNRLMWLEKNFVCNQKLKDTIQKGLIWSKAREQNWVHHGGKRQIWGYRKFSLLPSLFELFAAEMPEGLFQLCITIAKRNLIPGRR